ncbi:MAG: MCE family protein [Actinobacteria bacterium]|jgi:phospholipid/cholesterol/gamma-HCH transport system substrate-binding protein|nr:MCE family protein [Actinomycetota bacterium]
MNTLMGPTRRMLALLLALALFAGGCGFLGASGPYEVTAQLTRSYNLFPGSPVRVLGIDVGKIADIRVEPGRPTVEVVMRLDGDVQLPADATAIVVPESLLGERYVQLPAYTTGPTMEPGTTIPVERTSVPYEFDEVLEGLGEFVGGLEGTEVARLVNNLSEVLDGQGAQLGRTIDQAHEAIGVLKDNDDELVTLAARLSDLNETLGTRDQQLARIIQDFDALATTVVDDADNLDGALRGLVELTGELDGLLETNADVLEQDIATLTRVGRTAQRNLDNVSLLVLGSAELFRHAERIIDRERNMLPLQDQLFALAPPLTEAIVFRLQGICLAAGLPDEACAFELVEDLLGGLVCAPPMVPCPDTGEATPIEEALAAFVASDTPAGDAALDHLLGNAEDGDDDGDGTRPDGSGGTEQDPSEGGGLLDGLLGGREGDR